MIPNPYMMELLKRFLDGPPTSAAIPRSRLEHGGR